MAADLNVTYGEMNDSATRMRSNKELIDDKLEDCKSIVASLVGNGFVTRQASGRFDQVHSDFVVNAKEVMENLNLLSQWLDQAVIALEQMDAELAASLK